VNNAAINKGCAVPFIISLYIPSGIALAMDLQDDMAVLFLVF
jgi:hypothetical protein